MHLRIYSPKVVSSPEAQSSASAILFFKVDYSLVDSKKVTIILLCLRGVNEQFVLHTMRSLKRTKSRILHVSTVLYVYVVATDVQLSITYCSQGSTCRYV